MHGRRATIAGGVLTIAVALSVAATAGLAGQDGSGWVAPSQIVQGPGYVAIRYEMIHDARVIPIDSSTSPRPRLPSSIRQYFGDSRGRWDGDTLVVEVTNFPEDMVNYRGATGALRLTERFTRIADDTVRYEVTVTDPATFSRPWTAALSLRSDPGLPDVFEYACHEGNYAMRNILSAAREAEKAQHGAEGR